MMLIRFHLVHHYLVVVMHLEVVLELHLFRMIRLRRLRHLGMGFYLCIHLSHLGILVLEFLVLF
jgi:hypothetical protein